LVTRVLNTGYEYIAPAGYFVASTTYDFIIFVRGKSGKEAFKNIQVAVLAANAPAPIMMEIVSS